MGPARQMLVLLCWVPSERGTILCVCPQERPTRPFEERHARVSEGETWLSGLDGENEKERERERERDPDHVTQSESWLRISLNLAAHLQLVQEFHNVS